MTSQPQTIRQREATFASRTVTRIWQEVPTADNPYLAECCRCHGYDLMELAAKRSFVDVLFLLLQGELPTADQARVLETLFIAMINPGPRHPAVRASMYAGVGKTHSQHLLPIGLTILGGGHLGGEEVGLAMEFLKKNRKHQPHGVAADCLLKERPEQGDWHPVPGFGSRFGAIDPMPGKVAELLLTLPGNHDHLHWGADFVTTITPQGLGWLTPGVAAAAFCDLGFHPRAGAGLFQLLAGPGLLAHGLELANKPITAMPFLDEEHYVIEQPSRTR